MVMLPRDSRRLKYSENSLQIKVNRPSLKYLITIHRLGHIFCYDNEFITVTNKYRKINKISENKVSRE